MVLTVASFISFGQNTSKKLQSLTKLNLELQGVGVSYDARIGNSATVDFSAGIGTGGYDIWRSSFTYVVDPLAPTAFLSITPKFYYNRNKRLTKGKSGELNSGNYIGLRTKYTSRSLSENAEAWDALLFNAHWGKQRAIGKGGRLTHILDLAMPLMQLI